MRKINIYLNVGEGLGGDKFDLDGEKIGLHPGDCELHHSCGVGGVDDRMTPLEDVLLGVELVLSCYFTHYWSSHSAPVGGGGGGGGGGRLSICLSHIHFQNHKTHIWLSIGLCATCCKGGG